jgi:hypothetical protein
VRKEGDNGKQQLKHTVSKKLNVCGSEAAWKVYVHGYGDDDNNVASFSLVAVVMVQPMAINAMAIMTLMIPPAIANSCWGYQTK